jgi:hypothetical protein
VGPCSVIKQLLVSLIFLLVKGTPELLQYLTTDWSTLAALPARERHGLVVVAMSEHTT